MRNDYSKFTLVEMLRSYAEGTEEDTLGGNQRLDAADHIEALETKVEELEYKLNEAIAIAEREVILRKELQAKIEELTAELSIWKRRYNELYEAGIKLRSEYKKHSALKQEGER